ncbi:hypothetical protein [Mesorhizobium sp. M0848]|uniref:hypothetical protein n=1 Tax=Mesorhizobium sp. M0848 TaxID=2957012 RepID=UPI003335D28F
MARISKWNNHSPLQSTEIDNALAYPPSLGFDLRYGCLSAFPGPGGALDIPLFPEQAWQLERPVAKELILRAERRNKLIDCLASQNRKLGVEDKVVDSDADLLGGLDQVERGLPGDDVAGVPICPASSLDVEKP